MIDVYNMTSHTRPSRLSVCNIKKAGNGPGGEAIHVPYSREKAPMGGAPYIGLKLGGGRTFA